MRDVVTTAEEAARYRAAGLWTSDTLASRVCLHAAGPRGTTAAVVDQLGHRRHTYAQLADDAAWLAGSLAAAGVSSGDVVSVQLPNCYEAVVTAVATISLGAVVNPLLPNYRAHELQHVFRTATPRAVLTPAVYRSFDHRQLIAEVSERTGLHPFHVVVDTDGTNDLNFPADMLESSASTAQSPAGTAAAAVSELIFTSGTEATPKAIMHTEETANFAVRALFEDLELTGNHVVWMPSPVGHSTGFNYGIRAALYHGSTLVLQDRWDPTDAIDLISVQGCNYTLAATTFLDDLVRECERTNQKLPSLTHFGCGGAPVPAALVARADALGICVLRLYGSTEVLCATWNRPSSSFEKRSTTDGYPLQHTEISVRDEVGRELQAPAAGELHVRGPNTSVGFANDPKRTASSYLPGGWVRSGDLVRLDEDGYITVVGRKKEIIIRGGVNIAPREIEDLLTALPEVRQAAVVGVPDERLGERACACLVLHPGASLTFESVVTRLRDAGLATYKLPESMLVLDELPATASGKVQKHKLVGQIEAVEASREGR